MATCLGRRMPSYAHRPRDAPDSLDEIVPVVQHGPVQRFVHETPRCFEWRRWMRARFRRLGGVPASKCEYALESRRILISTWLRRRTGDPRGPAPSRPLPDDVSRCRSDGPAKTPRCRCRPCVPPDRRPGGEASAQAVVTVGTADRIKGASAVRCTRFRPPWRPDRNEDGCGRRRRSERAIRISPAYRDGIGTSAPPEKSDSSSSTCSPV